MIFVRLSVLLLSGTVTLWPCGEAPRLILPPVLGRAVNHNVDDLREPRCTEGLSTVQAGGQGNLIIGAVYTLPHAATSHTKGRWLAPHQRRAPMQEQDRHSIIKGPGCG
jgi:hypothetical protein